MKSTWIYVIGGFFVVGIFQLVLRPVVAQGNAQPVVQDKSLSGLRAPVPLTTDLDEALKKKEAEIAARELRVKESEARMTLEEERLRSRLLELEELQSQIAKLQTQNKQQNDEILKRLVKTYEAMNPKKAAGVIGIMPDSLAIDVLMGMKEKKVASILDVMEPNRAMTLSALISARRPASAEESKQSRVNETAPRRQ
jgi:flagellar motility protein MotE (MotC chaperone)